MHFVHHSTIHTGVLSLSLTHLLVFPLHSLSALTPSPFQPCSKVNAAMTAAHRKLYEAAAAGNAAAYEEQRQEVIRQFIITYLQVCVWQRCCVDGGDGGAGRGLGRHCLT